MNMKTFLICILKKFCDKYIKDKCVANNNSDLFFVDLIIYRMREIN